MDYTSIHIYGHLLTDEVLRQVEQDNMLQGNRDVDFVLDASVSDAIDYVWSGLRNDWIYCKSRNLLNDPYGTRRSRNLVERFLENIGYELNFQQAFVQVGDQQFVSYLDRTINNMPLEEDLKNPSSPVLSWYWISQSDIDSRLIEKDKNGDVKWQWGHNWLMGFCDITNATNERTIINSLIPNNVGTGDTVFMLSRC